MKYKVEKVDFDTILPIWQNKLWPNRESQIRSMSSMMYEGGFDMNIYKIYEPSFFAVYNNAKDIIGVNSGHRTESKLYRSRGIWVDPLYRKKGIAGILFCELFGQAISEQCEAVWSIPRKESLSAYTKYGFEQTSDFFDEGMEFGPNCYVYMKLDRTNLQH